MKEYEIKDHAPSLLPDGLDFELVWSDEFDGETVDTEKWDYRLCMMQKRHAAWCDDAVTVEGGCAHFKIFERDGEVVSSQLQTGYNFMDEPVKETTFGKAHLQWPIGKLKENKFTHRYGYYECRCRTQQLEGWWSAFWLQSPIIGSSLDPKTSGSEADIMESFHPGKIVPHVIITGGYGQDLKVHKVGGGEIDKEAFHTYGLLWLPDKYVFYVDGKEDGIITENVSDVDQFILISTETNGYRSKDHRPTEDAVAAARMGDEFVVDYVRVFDLKA